jgi:hypothetical protein
MKPGPVRSDLRACASREPKAEPRDPGPRLIPGVQEIDETGNVLSEIESQGFRKQKGFGLELN